MLVFPEGGPKWLDSGFHYGKAAEDLVPPSSLKGCGTEFRIRERWNMEPVWATYSDTELAFIDVIRRSLPYARDEFVTTHGIVVPLSSGLPAEVVYLLLNDAYEHGDLRLIQQYVEPGDDGIVLGCGIGVIASAIAIRTGRSVIAWDANPDLHIRITEIAQANNVIIHFQNGAAVGDGQEGELQFFVSGEFWSSSLNPNTRLLKEIVMVPAVSLADICVGKKNTLFIDIEGAETGIFASGIPEQIRKIFVELHTPNIGNAAAAEVMTRLSRQGFEIRDSAGLTSFWQRP